MNAIEVSGLSKRYVIEHESRHDNLRDTLHHSARKLWRRLRWGTGFQREEFWALRDVSFTVQPGEIVGIIGRNGAGKSTLLKILSRITEPTAGRITVRGRVASLLEVGTGFHPELSGRENIFLNGAILGMSRAEIRSKFDEIVAFAEIERFLDTPVKRYSSGMYVRLAFAVAAHLEPEILIVDEVLAVGDVAFQEKCLGRMSSISRTGRTILFVSHNMAAVQQLCQRVILLKNGAVASDGDVLEQINRYTSDTKVLDSPVQDLTASERAYDPLGTVRLRSVELTGTNPAAPWHLPFGEPLRVRIGLQAESEHQSLEIGVAIFNLQGTELLSSLSSWEGELGPFSRGTHAVNVDCGALALVPGVYRANIGIKSARGLEDHIPEAFAFEVVHSSHSSGVNFSSIRGSLALQAHYTLNQPIH